MDERIVQRSLELEFSPDERDSLERESIALRGDQPEDFLSEYEDPKSVRSMGLTPGVLAATEREFVAIGGWHVMRGRDELASKYRRLASVVNRVLKQKLN